MDYRQAGVDIEAGRTFVSQIRSLVESTHRSEVLGRLGGFSGLCQIPTGYKEPVLVSGTDGVGTKLKLAQSLNRHNTIGIDLVAMCVNDVLTCGAEPLFFLDYLATSKLDLASLNQVVTGIVEGCHQANCALLGGETAEMPDFYQPGEYDLAGFCVGVVEKSRILDGSQVQIGDQVIGLASQGVHSNGFSLVRKIIRKFAVTELYIEEETIEADLLNIALANCPAQLQGASLAEILLKPTQIYVQPVLALQQAGLPLHGMAHITGGGLPENLPRCLGPEQSIQLQPDSWPIPPIFEWLSTIGQVSPTDMFNTFNMGIGFGLIVPPDAVVAVITALQQMEIAAVVIGSIIAGEGNIEGLPV